MIQVRFNHHDAIINLNTIIEIVDIDQKILSDTIHNIQNMINTIKSFDLKSTVEHFVKRNINKIITLEMINKEILHEIYYCRLFLNNGDISRMILLNAGISLDSDKYNQLINKSITLGFQLTTFDNEDVIEFIMKFLIIYEIYYKSLLQRKYYVSINEFYNCTAEEIFDYCIL